MIELKGLITKDKLILFWKNIQNNISKIYLKKNDIDSSLSLESSNPVSNKEVSSAINKKADIDSPIFTGSISLGRSTEEDIITGENSFAVGESVEASGDESHAEGDLTIASSHAAHAEGYRTTSSGFASHVEGLNSTSSGTSAHAEGSETTASGSASHAEGWETTASGVSSHAEGYENTAEGMFSHVQGCNNTALNYQCVIGHYNDDSVEESVESGGGSGSSFIIGNGDDDSKSNAFRVTDDGQVYAKSASISTGADYAEYFEWSDSNPNGEDRRGYFVTLDNDMIRIANSNDYILGVISGFPSVIGNGDECWRGRYVVDDFDTPIIEEYEYSSMGETKKGVKWKENSNYDQTKKYIQRAARPEWDAVGMLGVLSVRDDGTCEVNGFCKVTDNGTATKSDSGYRVIKRVDKDVVKVVFR